MLQIGRYRLISMVSSPRESYADDRLCAASTPIGADAATVAEGQIGALAMVARVRPDRVKFGRDYAIGIMIGVLGFVVTGPQIELAGFIREPCQRSGCRATFYAWKAAAEPR